MKGSPRLAAIASGSQYARLVWPLSVAQLVSWGAIYYSFSLFLGPMEAELGLARTELTGALTLGLLVSGLCSPLVGSLVDRGHARILMTGASLAGGALLIAWSHVETRAEFIAIWIGLGAVLAAVLYEPAFAVVVRALGEQGKRGIASMTLIGGLASTVFVPLTYALIEHFEWRGALVGLALINFAVAAPIHFFTLSGETGRRRNGADAVPTRTRPLLAAALRQSAFWWMMLAFTAGIFSISAMIFHIVPMLSDQGHALGLVVSAIALFGPSQVAGRVLVTLIAPALGLMAMGSLAFGFPICAILLLVIGPESFWTIAGFSIFFGIGNGILTILRAVAVAELFGGEGFGSINGAINLPVNVARALAPAAVAAVWAATGGYDVPLWALLAISLAAFAAFVRGNTLARR